MDKNTEIDNKEVKEIKQEGTGNSGEDKNEVKDKDKEGKKLEKVSLQRGDKGFNLIAEQLEKAEEETQQKFRLDIRVVLFVFFVVVISLGVVGYNAYTTILLNREKAKFEALENTFESYIYTVQANNQINERYTFYNEVQEGFISSKEVLNFWQEVSDNLAEIRSIELTRGINFEVSGRSDNLRDVTKLWHFLSIDDRVKNVTLDSMSIPRDDDGHITFSFKGVLNLEYFNKRR